jgi:hypothetical protein
VPVELARESVNSMNTRRDLFATLIACASAPFARLNGKRLPRPDLYAQDFAHDRRGRISRFGQFHQSFDARDWARAFVAYVRRNPAIATDDETMVGWFANAIMRGYDEKVRLVAVAHYNEARKAGGDKIRALHVEAIRDAVAHACCECVPAGEAMYPAIAEAVAREILKLA